MMVALQHPPFVDPLKVQYNTAPQLMMLAKNTHMHQSAYRLSRLLDNFLYRLLENVHPFREVRS